MSTDELPIYEYTPLLQKDFIRVLRLQTNPANPSQIRATIEAHQLNEGISSYTSLSYTWGRHKDGEASLCRSITIGGCRLAVTENLYDALYRLQPQVGEPEFLLWVDAICINQADIEERNSQVAMMALVYSRASRLVIWLGEDHETWTDDLAYQALSTKKSTGEYIEPTDASVLADFDPRIAALKPSWLRSNLFRLGLKMAKHSSDRPSLNRLWPHVIRPILRKYSDAGSVLFITRAFVPVPHLIQLSRSAPLRKAVGDDFSVAVTAAGAARVRAASTLASRRYFGRRWILQEIYHSSPDNTRILWGRHQASRQEFLDGFDNLKSWLYDCAVPYEATRIRRVEPVVDEDRTYWDLFEKSYEDARTNLVEDNLFRELKALPLAHRDDTYNVPRNANMLLSSLIMFQEHLCADPRDILHAFSSMAEGELAYVPNYNLTVDETYLEFAKLLVNSGYWAYSLCTAISQSSERQDGEHSSSLPSWVTDWRKPVMNTFWTSLTGFKWTFSKLDFDGTDLVSLNGNKLRLGVRIRYPDFDVCGGADVQDGDESNEAKYVFVKTTDRICSLVGWPRQTGIPDGFIVTPARALSECYRIAGWWYCYNTKTQTQKILDDLDDSAVQFIDLC